MKKRSFVLLGFMAFVLGLGTLGASAQGPTVLTADIPFEFTIGRTTLPAGKYDVKLRETGGTPVVSFRNSDGDSFGLAIVGSVNAKKKSDVYGLTFVNVGDHYVLYKVGVPGREVVHQLKVSKKLDTANLARKTIEAKPAKSE